MNTVDEDIWLESYFIDRIFNNLIEKHDKQTISNKYILQMAEKFKFFMVRSPEAHFDINLKDIDEETLTKLAEHVKDCKTLEEKYTKLNYIFTEVIQLVMNQARPLILSKIKGNATAVDEALMNRIRELVSGKWKLVKEALC